MDSPVESTRSSSGELETTPPLISNLDEFDSAEIIALEDEVFDFECDSPSEKTQRYPVEAVVPEPEMAPLSASQVVELFKEAQTIAVSLQHASSAPRKTTSSGGSDPRLEELIAQQPEEEPSPVSLKVPARFADKPATPRTPDVTTATPRSLGGGSGVRKSALRLSVDGKEKSGGLRRTSSFNSKTRPAPMLSRDSEARKSLKRTSSFSNPAAVKKLAVSASPLKKPVLSASKSDTALYKAPNPAAAVSKLGPAPVKKLLGPSLLKPSVKAPPMKQTLLQKPGSGGGGMPQPKTLLGSKSLRLKPPTQKSSLGPLKPVKAVLQSVTPAQAKSETTSKPVNRLARPTTNQNQSTPVKQERNVQPKRLIRENTSITEVKTPERCKKDENICKTPVSVKSVKRRSFLPTPNKTGSSASSSSRRSLSSASSFDSNCSSPMLKGKSPLVRPALGLLVDINGVNEYSPSCLQPRKSRVVHTPMNKEEGNEPKRSLWSPVRKKKLMLGDEIHHCTKKMPSKIGKPSF